jgi:ppGpp synthetase/RelA/SpoT-type nucleotidyltranferase
MDRFIRKFDHDPAKHSIDFVAEFANRSCLKDITYSFTLERMETPTALDRFWSDRVEDVRAFFDHQPKYQRLCEEVAYTLEKIIKNREIEYAAVTFRAKTLSSFCEKVIRKGYATPLQENTDFAGVRIVYLYASDGRKIQSIVEKLFTVVEIVDKANRADPDRFGYGALHYLVKLKKKTSGARYEDLKDLICEIQVRTILQDSWATVAQHLDYKHESDVPVELRRKLNALAGLFETADDQFDELKRQRIQYTKNVKNLIQNESKGALDADLNVDNLRAYLLSRFSDRESSPAHEMPGLLNELKKFGYKTLKDLDDALSVGEKAALAYEENSPPSDSEDDRYTAAGIVRTCLDIVDSKYRESRWHGTSLIYKIKEFTHLQKK